MSDQDCTCDSRSWYGEGHDSACPVTIFAAQAQELGTAATENAVVVPKGIDARGRNGWFGLREAEVFVNEENTWVSFYSKQRGEYAPIEFKGTRKNVAKLFKQIAEELES